MKAILRTYRQSPRKVRLLADLIRGKKVQDAKNALVFAGKRAAPVIANLLHSAVENAKNIGVSDVSNLFVKEVRVDQGIVMKRIMPRARGSASPIRKKTSHIIIVLGVKGEKQLPEPKKTEKKEVKKEASKSVKAKSSKIKTKS